MAARVVGPNSSQLLQRLDRAGSRVETARTVLNRADRVIARPINGQDGEGAVEIVLGTGGSTDDVRLDPDWRALVGEHGLPAAATEAYRAAHGSRLSDWVGVIRENLSASGQVPLSARLDRADPEEPAGATGPAPDLHGLDTRRPDAEVAAELLDALDRAGTVPAPEGDRDVPDGEPPSGAEARRRAAEAFAGVSAAIVAAPRWLNLTLVTSGVQHLVGTLREVTDDLLDAVWEQTGALERTTGERVDAPAADGVLVRTLEAAAARARVLVDIPAGLGMVVAAVEEFVAHLRSRLEACDDPRHAQVS